MTHSTPLRVAFAGTPDFSVPCLEALIASEHEICAVYTQPDRPAGRGRQPAASPVKKLALAHNLSIHQPVSFKPKAEAQSLAAMNADVMIVIAYGLILPQRALDAPKHGCWNLHASLLPRWRGAAPIQRAIQAGDTQTGVCLMQMERGLDTGPVLGTTVLPVHEQDTGGVLHDRLALASAELMMQGLTQLSRDMLPEAKPQPEEGVCYAHKLDKAEAVMDLNQPAMTLARLVRAFNPWPVAECRLADIRLRVYEAEALIKPDHLNHHPAGSLWIDQGKPYLLCGDGMLLLHRIQKPGGKPMDASALLNGLPALKALAVS